MTAALVLKSPDGLSLEVRHYPGGAAGGPAALCLPGLTRNARDFETVAPWLAAGGRNVYALSFRGRGGSSPDPDYLNYRPAVYVGDVVAVLDQLGLKQAVLVGTSLGGLVAMLTNAVAPARVAAAIINDIGPEIAGEGIARIVAMMSAPRSDAADLDEAAAKIRAVNEHAFPDRGDDFWRAFARRTFRETQSGRWALDYDQKIGQALVDAPPAEGLWEAWASLAATPTLVVRGALSDILTPPIIEKMRAVQPHFDYCEVPGVGHAPMLDEAAAKAAIAAFLGRLG